MEAMREMPDKAFELAIVDVPYGIGESGERSTRPHKTKKCQNPSGAIKQYEIKEWDKQPPPQQYFNELFRVSVNQIVWGANHFISNMPFDSPCWIVWDKMNGDNDFADCELAWTSYRKAVRKFTWLWNGFQKQKPEERIHPTQKPVALYEWLLRNYAKAGDKILDTHLGSGSSRIAAYNLGFDFTGYEIDPDYFNAQEERFKKHTAQVRLFDLTEQKPKPEQINLLQGV
jgi:site-specific DNA-methyltransferase (adenine-specific)